MFRYLAAFVFFASLICGGILFSFTEREIHSTTSEYNGTVRVTQNWRGIRFLRFGDGDAVQSAVRVKDPLRIVTPYVSVSLAAFSFSAREPLRVLVIGMGAGSQAVFARRFLAGAVVDAVDIDSSVVNLAGSYFGFQPDQLLRAHVADGRQFVEAVTAPYDVILLDAFNGEDVPAHMVTVEFFQAVRRALAPGGVVASNVLYRDRSPRYDSILATAAAVFGPGIEADIAGGAHQKIVFHFQAGSTRIDELHDRARLFASHRGYPEGVGLVQHVRAAVPAGGVVLQDLANTRLN